MTFAICFIWPPSAVDGKDVVSAWAWASAVFRTSVFVMAEDVMPLEAPTRAADPSSVRSFLRAARRACAAELFEKP